MKFMFGLRHPLICNPSTTLSNPCNKVRGDYFSKEVFLRLYHAFSFLRLYHAFSFLRPCRCELFYIYMCTYVDVNLHMWLYNITLIWCLCQASSSRTENEPGYRKRQFLNITKRHQREGQGKISGIERSKKKKKKKEQTSNKQMNRLTRKERKKRKEENNATCWKKRWRR